MCLQQSSVAFQIVVNHKLVEREEAKPAFLFHLELIFLDLSLETFKIFFERDRLPVIRK